MRKLAIGSLIVLMGVLAFGKQNAHTYDVMTAANLPIMIQDTHAFQLVPSRNTVTIPQVAGKTFYDQSEYLYLDQLDVLRINDWSTSPNSATVNVTVNYYTKVKYQTTRVRGGSTLNVWASEVRLIRSEPFPLNEDVLVTGNRLNLCKFVIARIPGVTTATVTLNIVARNSSDTIAHTVTHDVVRITKGTETLLDYSDFISAKICMYEDNATAYLGGEGIRSTNFGVKLNAASRCETLNGVGAYLKAILSETSTLNVLLVK